MISSQLGRVMSSLIALECVIYHFAECRDFYDAVVVDGEVGNGSNNEAKRAHCLWADNSAQKFDDIPSGPHIIIYMLMYNDEVINSF